MPIATASGSGTDRVELKSLEGAYVVLKRLTYDQYLERRDMAMKMAIKDDGGGAGRENVEMTLASAQKVVVGYEFQHCIIEHNLQNDDESPMQFPRDMSKLNPQVGEEIAQAIAKMNEFEADLKN